MEDSAVPDKDQLLFPVLKTKVEQTQRSSVFMLTMQELHHVFSQQHQVIIYPLVLFFLNPSFELPSFAYHDIPKSVNSPRVAVLFL